MKKILIVTLIVLFSITCSSMAFASEYGKIKGTITWQYNNYIGTKGDNGAKIYIIPTNFDITSISLEDEKRYYNYGTIPKDTNLFYAKADGYGSYEIDGIPAGEYYVLIISDNVNKDSRAPMSSFTEYVLKKMCRDLRNAGMSYETAVNKHTTKTVQIKVGITTSLSHDFGYKDH